LHCERDVQVPDASLLELAGVRENATLLTGRPVSAELGDPVQLCPELPVMVVPRSGRPWSPSGMTANPGAVSVVIEIRPRYQ
jgi:hypothetical protein